MTFDQKKIAQEQIWKYLPLEQAINQQVHQALDQKKNIAYRIVDSVFAEISTAWTDAKLIVTDNIPTRAVCGKILSLYPEYWHVYHYQPVYQPKPARYGYNCFMNRISEDRGQTFQELKRRGLLSKGLVSFNCSQSEYMDQYEQAKLYDYWPEHDLGLTLVPYNTVESHGGLEQCIIDSNISLILETYISDSHIVFSEKIFRALQLPRPWLLYCSPGSVDCLKHYGFDVLDDYVDHSYDAINEHNHRHVSILDQLETFVDRTYNNQDYIRFDQAAAHNQQLVTQFAKNWPKKLNDVLTEIQKL
jgi:hypothetical protein